MPEREYYDYDEWMRAGGDPTYGQAVGFPPPEPTTPYMPPTAPVAPAVTPGAGGGLDPMAQADEDLRRAGYVQRPDGSWYKASADYSGGGRMGNFDPRGWAWPEFNAPQFSFDAPPDFVFQNFDAPTREAAEKEPGYAFARDEGLRALENNAFARGLGRTGGTLKDFIAFGNKFAEQNYGNVFNRARDVFSLNEGNRFNAHNANFGNRLTAATSVFDRNYKGAWDMFQSKMEPAKMEFQDAFNRWNAQLQALSQPD